MGVLLRLAAGFEIPSNPSENEEPPQQPINPPDAKKGLLFLSLPEICGAEDPPSFAAGILSGNILENAPKITKMQSEVCIRGQIAI